MNIKIERTIGVILFIIGLALGLILNLFASDLDIQVWYQKNRTLVWCLAGVLILIGIILISLSFGKASKSSSETKRIKQDNQSVTAKDEQNISELLNRHQENLRKLIKQKSIYAASEEPLHLLNQIEAEENAIKEIKEKLIKLGEQFHA
jgi:uncharacterized membrane protein YgaE (UPF0421/DUF939 family)